MNALLKEAVPYPLQITFVLLFGLALGSFGNMLLYRMPRQAPMTGRSHCTRCNHTLFWYDLVPILSFVLLGGKCRCCRASISWRYPFFEIVTALLFVLLFIHMKHAGGIALLLNGIAIYSLILIAFYDFDTQNIPDVFVFFLLLASLLNMAIVARTGEPGVVHDAFLGALIPLAFFGTLWLVSRGAWIGSGDILLGVSIGILLGAKLTTLALFFAYVSGALAAILLLTLRLIEKKSLIAFGPFIAGGALLALFFGEAFLEQYASVVLGV